MACYISSNNNRVYVALETDYGEIGAVSEQHRIPLIKLAARQVAEPTGRRDKTGSRTFVGLPNRIRKNTTFRLNTFMTQLGELGAAPSHGPLFQAAMGGDPLTFGGGTVSSVTGQTNITFAAPHGLLPGQGIIFGGEMRFVAAVESATAAIINAPFSETPVNGSPIGPTTTFVLSTDVLSASIFDFWDPSTAVQRVVNGSAMNEMRVKVNGDFHEFEFAGPARDIVDSATFEGGQAGLSSFPEEPAQVAFDYTIVPGHLGQVWMGTGPSRFFTLTAAELVLNNNIEQRVREFGLDQAPCITAGQREVRLDFSIFEHDDEQTIELYQAARQRSPVSVMLQLGEQAGQLFGAYMPAMVPEVPEFDDRETRLQWSFSSNRAQGAVDDELYIAFG